MNAITLTVSQLNEYIKALLDSQEMLYDIYIKGEISNFTNHFRSGHFFFSLKDSESVVKAVMFNSYASRLNFVPEDGMKVIVRGQVSVYPRDGIYQIYVSDIQPDGIGALYLAYEQLKASLEAEGIFAPEHKRPIPKYPQKIGIVTAKAGAAVADMKNILTRRYPLAQIIIYPSLVQGKDAPENLCRGIRYFNENEPVDTIIIGRGGGSIEDLWAFNNRELAYTVFNSQIPVISAVGHETDFTICDFAADLRAPTPSAAAELAVPDITEIRYSLTKYPSIFKSALEARYDSVRAKLSEIKKSRIFTLPYEIIERQTDSVNTAFDVLSERINTLLQKKSGETVALSQRIEALSPISTLQRGFSIVTDGSGKTVSDTRSVKKGDLLCVALQKGSLTVEVKDKKGIKYGNKETE